VSPGDLANGLAAVPLGHPEWGRAKADGIGFAVSLRPIRYDRIGTAVALALEGCTAVTNSTVAVRTLVIRRRFIVYVAICARCAGIRVDVALV
jgi:hypothetical protein